MEKFTTGIIKGLVSFIPIKKWYGSIRLYSKENFRFIIQFRRGKSTGPDLVTGFIWETDKKGIKYGPFCPECWYKNKNRIPLIPTATYNVYQCNGCSKLKRPENFVEPNTNYNINSLYN